MLTGAQGLHGEKRGNGGSVYQDARPRCENCRGAGTFYFEVLLVSEAPTQSPEEGKQTLYESESWSPSRLHPGPAGEGLPEHYKDSHCFSSPPPASQNSLDPHRYAINSGINSSRGKLSPGARTCSHLSGNSFAQACLCFLPSTFLRPAGPGQARDIPPST